MSKSKKNITPFRSWESRAPNGNETGYIRLTSSLLLSVAYKKLSHTSRTVFVMMKLTAKGNESFSFSRQQFLELVGGSSHTYKTAIDDLIKFGFIERCPRCCFSPSKFVFSENWKNI